MQASFPHLAGWRSSRFWPEGMSFDPQEAISGAETIVPTMRGRWKAAAMFVIKGEAGFLQWQAFLAQMEGRVGTTLVPCFSHFRPRDRSGLHLPFCTGGGIDSAQAWEHFGVEATSQRRAWFASAAPLRATSIDVMLGDTTGLRPGQYFSVGERLHQVQTHSEPVAGLHRLTIRPPLREAVAAGAAVEVQRPVCRMRFTTETEGQFAQDYADRAPKIEVSFQEAL